MRRVNMHEAKTHLSRLVEEAVNGEPFIIARAGKPLVKVTAISDETLEQNPRMGFMIGKIGVPDDFDRRDEEEIAKLFGVMEGGVCAR